jgi:thiamine-monophosphate kinase
LSPDPSTTNASVAELGERALIERIRTRVPAPPDWVRVGIGDDAAVIAPDRNGFDVVTTDSLVEGVNFDRRFVPAPAVGFRGLAANLSDLAAMGARPRAALLSLALPDSLPIRDFDGLIDGVLAVAARHEVALVGGNIARSPGPLIVDITAIGSAQERRILSRSGARPGDAIYVSGEIGAAAAGLEWCRAHADEALKTRMWDPASAGFAQNPPENPAEAGSHMKAAIVRFLYPEPRVRLGWILARTRAATSCVDLSDGLADGVHQLAAASGVGAFIDADLVPIAAGAAEWFRHSDRDPLVAAITGGDDYELLFTVPLRRGRLIESVGRQVRARRGGDSDGTGGVATARLRLTRIGAITREPGVVLRRNGGDEALPRGFTHFR